MDAKRAAALLILLGCAPPRLPAPTRSPLPAACGHPEKIALDGTTLACADGQKLVVCGLDGSQPSEFPAAGAPDQLVAGNVGDGRAVVAGWGMDRNHRDARARVIAYFPGGGSETVLEPQTTRQDVEWLRLVDWPGQGAGLLWAVFDSKYFVKIGFSRRQGKNWQTRELGRFRMVSAVDLAGDQVVVGRLYGDDLDKDGDAFLLAADGARTMLPTTRGLRSLVANGREIFIGDGWHKEYAAKAKGLVTRITLGPPPRAERVDELAGQFMVHKLALADLDGDGSAELLGLGTKSLRAWTRRGDRFRGQDLATDVVDFDAGPGVVVLAGGKPGILRFGKP